MKKINIRKMEVSDPLVRYIFNEEKDVEVRKNNPESWGSVTKGDMLNIFRAGTSECKLYIVTDVRTYLTFYSCMVSEGVRRVLPGYSDYSSPMALAEKVYFSFDGEENFVKVSQEYDKFGCIAFEIRPVMTKFEPTIPKEVPEQRKELESKKQEWEGVLKEVGIEKFGEAFVLAHMPEDRVISPEEFFVNDEENEGTQKLAEEFRLEERRFLLQFYERNFRRLNQDCIIKTFAAHVDYDIPCKVIDSALALLQPNTDK